MNKCEHARLVRETDYAVECFEHEAFPGVCFNISALREQLRSTHPEIYSFDMAQVMPFLIKYEHDPLRVAELDETSWKHDPVIILHDPETLNDYVIDGIHRIHRRHKEGCSDVIGYIVSRAQVPTVQVGGTVVKMDWQR